MIIDKFNTFSDAQDIGQVAAAYDSTILDFKKPGGMYDHAWLFLRIDEAVVGSGASVLFELRTSDDNFSASDVLLFSTGVLGVAALTVDTIIAKIRIPLGVLRYLKMLYTVSGATTTAGTVDAFIVPDVPEGF